MKALTGTPVGDFMNAHRLYLYGWINAAANVSSSSLSNSPESYWLVPNTALLDQLVVRLERPVDSVQKDHVDWGFRSSFLYGSDYRYMTAGGWTSRQLLVHNQLYGYDFTEQYLDVYVPGIADGTIIRVGRWIACPDIETQFAPDNYMGSHSILFTFDTYTQTGFMVTHQLNRQWMVQWGVHAGTDMAPWYTGAVPTGLIGVRWVAPSNDDSVYLVLNAINTAKFQRFQLDGQPAGHDNFNYLVGTWQHRFNRDPHEDRGLCHVAARRSRRRHSEHRSREVVRWRRGNRRRFAGPELDVRAGELHDVRRVQARLLHRPQRVVA